MGAQALVGTSSEATASADATVMDGLSEKFWDQLIPEWFPLVRKRIYWTLDLNPTYQEFF